MSFAGNGLDNPQQNKDEGLSLQLDGWSNDGNPHLEVQFGHLCLVLLFLLFPLSAQIDH